jgi:redox-sensitive bicupin YhaK (pirin superfamily)
MIASSEQGGTLQICKCGGDQYRWTDHREMARQGENAQSERWFGVASVFSLSGTRDGIDMNLSRRREVSRRIEGRGNVDERQHRGAEVITHGVEGEWCHRPWENQRSCEGNRKGK